MLKVFGFVRRNARLTHDEYRAAHVGYHNSFGRRLPGIRGYILNVTANRSVRESLGPLSNQIVRGEPEGFDDMWDGWGQLMFDSLPDYLAGKSPARDRAGPNGLDFDPRVKEVGGDGDHLYNGSPFQFQVDEHVSVPVRRPERKLFKLVQFARRRPDMSPEEFRACWSGVHAALVASLPGLRGHILNFRTTLDVMTGFFPPDSEAFTPEGRTRRDAFYGLWDGIAELWFDAPDQFATGRADPAIADRLDRLEQRLFDAVWYREVDETIAVMPNRAPAPDFYFR
ncbi:EthD domain-containing protein [Iodidimonas sp. SYSU 1G8]|uniref:EthD domain-containing protein n=1 Tax=Iodidimonas sp. SYSU 1G8 TaxID=3133967 RepID=UPI0031FEDA03